MGQNFFWSHIGSSNTPPDGNVGFIFKGSTSGINVLAKSLQISDNGRYMYVTLYDYSSSKYLIRRYYMSSIFNISTINTTSYQELDLTSSLVSGQNSMISLNISKDQKNLYFLGGDDRFYSIELNTPYDLTSWNTITSVRINTSSIDNVRGVYMNPNGTNFTWLNFSGDLGTGRRGYVYNTDTLYKINASSTFNDRLAIPSGYFLLAASGIGGQSIEFSVNGLNAYSWYRDGNSVGDPYYLVRMPVSNPFQLLYDGGTVSRGYIDIEDYTTLIPQEFTFSKDCAYLYFLCNTPGGGNFEILQYSL